MASATVDSPSDRLKLESIATVDLRYLSQSELYALSLCSDAAFDPRRCDDVVIPKIDRSVFNESAGSRKQTYSRLRLAPRKPESSASAAIPHRTPHLSALTSATVTTDDTDTERAENSRIIGLLKGLFSEQSNGDELVSICVEYSESPTQFPNVDNNEKKRKRGRPRRNQNLAVDALAEGTGRPPARSNVINGIFVYDNVEDKDKDIVNKDGIVVDLTALACLEDPYLPELQRRSENLKTEDEFLGFLRGLNGEWGSRRKKKRIVDASELGNALPKGWKLLLSLKKKEGRVWLYVRRYISPSRQHFMSCKEVASYLLSLYGLQHSSQRHCDQLKSNIKLTHSTDNGYSTSFEVKETNKSQNLDCSSPSAVTYVSDEKQFTSEVGNSADIQVGKVLKCEKCKMRFNGKDELMHHQLSSHRRRRSRFGTSITDGVIIKDGQYECQFCHKRFVERHRYNGHVGAHKRHHLKNDEVSQVLNLQSSVNPVSPCQVYPNQSTMQASTGSDFIDITANNTRESQLKHAFPHSDFKVDSKIDVHTDMPYHEVNNLPHGKKDSQSNVDTSSLAEQLCIKHDMSHRLNNPLGWVDEASSVAAAEFNISSKSGVVKSDKETIPNGEFSANKISECPAGQMTNSDRCPLSFGCEEITSGSDVNVKQVSASVEDPIQQADTKIISLDLHGNENTCYVGNKEDMHINSPLERSKIDKENFENKVVSDHSSLPISSSPDDVNTVLSFALIESKQKRDSESSDKVIFGVKDIYNSCKSSVSNAETYAVHNSGNKEVRIVHGSGHLRIDEDPITSLECENSVSCPLIPSHSDQLGDTMINGSVVSVATTEIRGQDRGAEINLHNLSGYEQTCSVKLDLGNISTRKVEDPKADEIHTYGNNEIAFGSSHQIPDTQNRSPEYDSLFLSGNQGIFVEVNNSTEVLPDNGSLTKSCSGKSFGDAYIISRDSDSSVKELKPYQVQNPCDSELNVVFGGNDSGIVADIMCNVPMEQTFFEINQSSESCKTRTDQKQKSSLCGPSYYAETGVNEKNLSRVHTGRVWDEPIIDEAANFGHDKLVIGFDNNGSQSHGDTMCDSMWRINEKNALATLVRVPTQQEGSSSCPFNINMISDKSEDAFLGLNGKYGSMSGFDGAQSGDTAHVEFSFLTAQSLDSLPRDSKGLYDTEMGQGFDSSFWLEKDDLSLNIAAGNQVTSECVWCRNEFRHEPVHSGTQMGTLGSICPACSANVSQQFNFF